MPTRPARPWTTLALLLPVLGFATGCGSAPPSPEPLPFRNPDLSIDARVADLIGRLTIDEKVSLMVDRAAPIDRLGIEAFPWWNEALHGVARAGRATVFPQAIGLAATWDTDLMHRVATAIADEARAMNNRSRARGQHDLYQGLTFWSPNINIFRDPRWGRGQETYGEDPTLTGRLGVAFVTGMQGDDPRYLKTIATPKHYAVHSGPESARHTFDARPSEADFRDTYLAAFRALIVEGRAGSVMCAYNSVRGLPACANGELLDTILRGEWGFDGYVVSDCGAVEDIVRTHQTVATAEEAAVMALEAGTDLECGPGSWAPGSPDTFLTLADAVRDGRLQETDVDRALQRLLRAQMRLGVYDAPERVPFTSLTYETVVNSTEHQALAVEAARKSLVLLKNDAGTLPLRPDLATIAVIGPNADDVEVLLGNYHGTPFDPVTILRGIREAVSPATKVVYARGGPLADGLPDLQPVPASALSHIRNGAREPGLEGAYYRGHFDGGPVMTRVDDTIEFDWADGSPLADSSDPVFSARWTGEVTAPVTGVYALGFRGATSYRVLVGDKQVAGRRTDHEATVSTGEVTLRAGQRYRLRVEYEHEKYDAVAELLWDPPGDRGDETPAALDAARTADAVVLVLGLSSRLEGEQMPVAIEGFAGGDRTSLDLPKVQQSLLEAVVAAAGARPVVLVLLSGSALGVTWADAHVPAILQAWYPGQAAGTAIADVLFGKISPGGRLPVTFYRSVADLPAFTDYAMAGRTYRFFGGTPLYPFGHGLSYSAFEYQHLQLPESAEAGSPVEVSVEITNTGSVTADEVVQVYLTGRDLPAPAPIRTLVGFTRITLEDGERRTVRFTLAPRDFSFIDAEGQRTLAPGRFVVTVGGKQPGMTGTADAPTTGVLAGEVRLTGAKKAIEP